MKERNIGILISLFAWAGVFLMIGGMSYDSYITVGAGFVSFVIGIIITLNKEFGFNPFKRKK